ncbi:uncharacterized protein sS8_3279 [Methylocaldum marinum]|uniref:Uncharacterized protein n=1 Tax=Methylocaldum marinum TaxID=1432792 RepID=A0A250KUG0_9GAMM|nr:uncharacterized protein sS8_3279 [Methylocaldum marinum]
MFLSVEIVSKVTGKSRFAAQARYGDGGIGRGAAAAGKQGFGRDFFVCFRVVRYGKNQVV